MKKFEGAKETKGYTAGSSTIPKLKRGRGNTIKREQEEANLGE